MQKLSVTVISDPHYYSKRNWAGGDPFQFAPKRDQLYKEGSEEILKHVFNEICQDNEEQIVLINGDLTNNGEITSHEEMRAAAHPAAAAGGSAGRKHTGQAVSRGNENYCKLR